MKKAAQPNCKGGLQPANKPDALADTLVIRGLSKTYPDGVRALNNVSLSIPRGMFGMLGPNGAGKSTLMRTIATLQTPDSGTISFGELDVLKQKRDVQKILGYLPQEFGTYPGASPLEMLDHIACLKGVSSRTQRRELVNAMLHKVNLYQHRKKAITGFSGGMKQRYGIAQALLGKPELLIVDEPTAGLDPGERNRFYNLLAEIGENIVVILSTHIVQDVRDLCTNMAIINKGTLIFAGAPRDAESRLDGKVWRKSVSQQELIRHQQQHKIISMRFSGGRRVVHVLSEQDLSEEFELIDPDLEDVFFSMLEYS